MDRLISIIIPVYNCEKYLERCINSVLEQSYSNLELILVDDGSTDRSGSICDDYQKKDDRVVVVHSTNGGAAKSRNSGIDIARGEYIGFIDSDDYISPSMYEHMICVLNESNAEMAVCNYLYVDKEGNDLHRASSIVRDEVIERIDYLKRLTEPYSGYYITPWNRVYRRELFNGLRFPEGMTHEDNVLTHRIVDRCGRIAIISKEYAYYTQRSDSVSKSHKSYRFYDNIDALADRIEFYGKKEEYYPLIAASIHQLCSKFIEFRRLYIFHAKKSRAGLERTKKARELVKAILDRYEIYTVASDMYMINHPYITILKDIIAERTHL